MLHKCAHAFYIDHTPVQSFYAAHIHPLQMLAHKQKHRCDSCVHPHPHRKGPYKLSPTDTCVCTVCSCAEFMSDSQLLPCSVPGESVPLGTDLLLLFSPFPPTTQTTTWSKGGWTGTSTPTFLPPILHLQEGTNSGPFTTPQVWVLKATFGALRSGRGNAFPWLFFANAPWEVHGTS